MGSFSPIHVDAVKLAINLGAKSHFGMVYVLKDRMRLEFNLDHKIDDSRIDKVEKIGPQYVHSVSLTGKSDVDRQLNRLAQTSLLVKKLSELS